MIDFIDEIIYCFNSNYFTSNYFTSNYLNTIYGIII